MNQNINIMHLHLGSFENQFLEQSQDFIKRRVPRLPMDRLRPRPIMLERMGQNHGDFSPIPLSNRTNSDIPMQIDDQ